MPRTKKLTMPQTSSSFQWNAPEVVSLCSQGSLYIMEKRLPLLWPGEMYVTVIISLAPLGKMYCILTKAILDKRIR